MLHAGGGLHARHRSRPPRGRGPTRLGLASLSLLALGLAGCASLAAARAAEARLRGALDAARCERTLDEAWDEARRVLAERAYPLAGLDAKAAGQVAGILEQAGDKGGVLGKLLTRARETHQEGEERVLETAWSRQRRYRLVGSPGAPGCRVAFLAIREDPHERLRDAWEAPRRDLELELLLLRRLAPDEAARVEAAAGAAPGGP